MMMTGTTKFFTELEFPDLKQKSSVEIRKLYSKIRAVEKVNIPLAIYGVVSLSISYVIILVVFANDSSIIHLFRNSIAVYKDYQKNFFNLFNVLLFLGSILFYILLLKESWKVFKKLVNFKSVACVFIFLGIALFSFSQQKIKGVIKDTQDAPIAYAFIKTSSNPIGVVANEKGEFQINVIENPKDSLFISHIGFKKLVFLPTRKDLYEITLENNSINLEEVGLVEFSGSGLIERIKNNISKNYPAVPCSQEMFFNYEAKNEKLFLGYFNGNLNINIDNYGNPNHRLKPRLLDANINLNNFNKTGNFYYISSETILSYIFPTNLPFLENEDAYKFLVSKFNLADHSYYKVNFEPKVENEKWRYLGNFIVDADNYAIEEAQFSLVKNLDNKDVSINIGFSTNKTTTTTDKESVIIKYKKEGSKYYNAFLKYSSHSSFYDSKIKSTREITISAVSMTTSYTQKPSKEQKEYGKPFNLFTLKTQKNGPKVDKNSYFGIDLEQKIKQLKLDNPELRE